MCGVDPDLAQPARQAVAAVLLQLDGMRAADAANAAARTATQAPRGVAAALHTERLADILEELPSDDAQSLIAVMGTGRARNVLGAMEPTTSPTSSAKWHPARPSGCCR